MTQLESSGGEAEDGADAPPVEQIGRFAVLRKLGEGGMGVVYAAHDTELDRDVAMKLLRADTGSSGPARARLLREARAMAKLSHPNVITIYDVGTVDEQVFIAMELVHGVTLKRWIKTRPRTWRGVIERFAEAGHGLAAAHRAGLIHRDFKPDNVLVGDDGRVRVLDFGLARPLDVDDELKTPPGSKLDKSSSGERLTVTGAVMGTPAYMSPEQWRSSEIDHRSDQFSFCVTLWEALFGGRPFPGSTAHAIASAVLGGEITPPSDDHSVPAWLVRVLRRGLATRPDDRFESMDALLFVLSRLQGERTHALPPPETPDAPLFARRYELPEDPAPGATAVAKDRLTGRTVAVRWLHRPLAEQIRKLAGLRHPNLAALVDFGQRDDQAWAVTEHFEGAVDLLAWSRDQPEAIRGGVVMQLLRVLAYLHGAGLVHRGLSPRTVKVVHGQVKLVDPTPCVVGARERSVDASYAAPEVLLEEDSDPASDLYSVGVLAHEIFVGRRPHGAENAGELVDAALSRTPALQHPDLDPAVAKVIETLLQPDRAQRYGSALDAMRALVDDTGLPLTYETVETRESALRTARFAGRDRELQRLVQALRRSADGAGEIWLVGGESGVGKSRLLDELEAEAISRGALVVRGQAKAEGGHPYEVWQTPLRLLALGATEEAAAWVIAQLVPDLQLRGRPPQPVSGLDAKSTQARLHNAVLHSMRDLGRPLLLLLEDLHWASAASVGLLERLASTMTGLQVLIVASYRDDEAPKLPESVEGARTLRLSALDARAVAEVAEAMTGSRDPQLVALLERETEGNGFFLVEVVRMLAEEAGALHGIAGRDLPETVSAGGVRRLLRRRLDRVEAWARPLLEAAAVAGRRVDVEVLEALRGDVPLQEFVQHAAECAVFEADGDGWRFRHDKLREHLLSELDEASRAELHRDVLAALEQSDALPQALAFHAAQAGDLAREAQYSGRAGVSALRSGAYDDAAVLLARAIELREHGSPTRAQVLRWYRMLGEAHYVLGDLSRAVETLAATLTELGRPLPSSRIGLAVLLMRLVFVQAVLLALPGRFKASSDARREELREAAKAAGRIANLSTYSGDQMRIFTGSLLSANLAERAGDANPYSLAVMGYSASYMGLSRLADRYFARASAAAREHDDPIGLTEATQMECAYRLGNAELGRVRQLLDEGYGASERAGYRLGMALSEGFVGQCEFLAGNFEGMLAHYLRAQELLTLRSPEHEHSFLCGEGLALCMLGRLDEAQTLLTDAVEGVSAEYLLGDAFVLSSRAYVHAWAGDHERALEAATATNAYVRGKGIAVPGPCGYVISGPLEAFLCAAEADRQYLPDAKTQATVLDRWADKHPVGEAGALLARGRVAALEDRPDTASELFEHAASAAKRHALRFEQAQAELHLGRLRGPDTAPGRNHLEQARTLFHRCGATHFTAKAQQSLEA